MEGEDLKMYMSNDPRYYDHLQLRGESIPFFSKAARQCVGGEVPLAVPGNHEEVVSPKGLFMNTLLFKFNKKC